MYAIAHIRGGGEMGRQWYETGKYLHKKNTFTDFIAVAEYLVQERLTSPRKLCIQVGLVPALPSCHAHAASNSTINAEVLPL